MREGLIGIAGIAMVLVWCVVLALPLLPLLRRALARGLEAGRAAPFRCALAVAGVCLLIAYGGTKPGPVPPGSDPETERPVHTITYDLDGGENDPDNPDSYREGGIEIRLGDPTREGYVFLGWEPEGVIPAGATGDYAFTAKWRPVKTWTVVFLLQDGGPLATNSYVEGASVATFPTPPTCGLRFAGWCRDGLAERRLNPTNVVDDAGWRDVCGEADRLTMYPAYELPVREDGRTYIVGGQGLWTVQKGVAAAGSTALRSAPVDDVCGMSWVEASVTGYGLLTFSWKTSCVEGPDAGLTFALDGWPEEQLSGAFPGWREQRYALGGGGTTEHVLRWTFSRGTNAVEGLDCGWLDALDWVPGGRSVTATFDYNDGTRRNAKRTYTVGRTFAGYTQTQLSLLEGEEIEAWEKLEAERDAMQEKKTDEDFRLWLAFDWTPRARALEASFAKRRAALEWPEPEVAEDGGDVMFAGWFTQASGGDEIGWDDMACISNTTYYAHWTANLNHLLNTPETLAAEAGLKFSTHDDGWEAAPADGSVAYSARIALEDEDPAEVDLTTQGVGVLSLLFKAADTNVEVRVVDVLSAVGTNTAALATNETVCVLDATTGWQRIEVPYPYMASIPTKEEPGEEGAEPECHEEILEPRHALSIFVGTTAGDGVPVVAELADVRWTAVAKTDFMFDANGGLIDGRAKLRQTYPTAGRYGTLPEPEREGYAFAGWFASETGGDPVRTEDWVAVQPTTLRARWTTRIATVADLPGAAFRTGGDAYWFGQTTVSHDGRGAVQSGEIDDEGSTWFDTVVEGDSFLSFWWLLDSTCTCHRLKVAVDGEKVGTAETDWTKFYYYLTEGRHRVTWTYYQNGAHRGGRTVGCDGCGEPVVCPSEENGNHANSATGYVDQISVERNTKQNGLPAWADKLQHYGVWITENLPALVRMYQARFAADAADYEARILHAAATLLQLGEDPQLVALLARFGYTPVYAPLGFNGDIDLSAAPRSNAVVDQVAAKSVAALQTALADLEAVPGTWTGSIRLSPDVYPVDAETRVDIADVLVLKAAVQHALATVAYVQGLDLSVDYGTLQEEIEDQLVPEVSELPEFGAGEAAWSQIPVQNGRSHRIGRNADIEWVKCVRKGDMVHLVARMSDTCPDVPWMFSPGFRVFQKIGGRKKAKFNVLPRYWWDESDHSDYYHHDAFRSREGQIRTWANCGSYYDDGEYFYDDWEVVDGDVGVDYATMTALTYRKGRLLEMRIHLSATMDPKSLRLAELVYSVDRKDPPDVGDGLVPAADIVVDGRDGDWAGVPLARWGLMDAEDCRLAASGDEAEDDAGGLCGPELDPRPDKYSGGLLETAWLARSASALHAAVRLDVSLDGYEVAEATINYRTKPRGEEREEWNLQTVRWEPYREREDALGTPTGTIDQQVTAVVAGDFVEISCAFPDDQLEEDDEARLDLNDVKIDCIHLRLVNVDGGKEYALAINPAPAGRGDDSDKQRLRFLKYRNVLDVLDAHPRFLSAARSQAKLGEAKAWLKKSVQTMLSADAACDRRKDGLMHLFDYDPAAQAQRRKVREGLQDALASLDRAVTMDMDARLGSLEAAGAISKSRAARIRRDPVWGEGGSATVYLGSLFDQAPSRALLPCFLAERVPYFDTLPDPTFGGLVPGLTREALWTALDGRLSPVAKNFTGTAWPTPVPKRGPVDLWMVKSVKGGGVLTYVADLEHAVEGSALECYVDEVLQPNPVSAGAKTTLSIDLGRAGDHDIVWHFRSRDAQMFDVVPVRDIRGAAARADRAVAGVGPYAAARPQVAAALGAFDRLWGTVEPDGQGGYVTTGGHELPFDGTTAETFDGVVVDADGADAGTIQVKTSRATARKAASLKATVLLLGQKKLTFQGSLNADGTCELVARGVADRLRLVLGANGLNGTWGRYVIVGARNSLVSKRPHAAAGANLSRWTGVYTVALGTREATGAGAAFAGGSSVLSLSVGARGKVRITGTMADGAKVSATSQLLVGERFCTIPVTLPLYSRKGGLAFRIGLAADEEPCVFGLSAWDASASRTPFVATMDPEAAVARLAAKLPGSLTVSLPSAPDRLGGGAVFTKALPAGLSVAQAGGRFTTPRTTRVALKGSALEGADGANPSGLRLSLTARSGVFKGAFTIYALEGGKLKKVKATVTGGMVGTAGYGSVTVRNVGSWPFVLR